LIFLNLDVFNIFNLVAENNKTADRNEIVAYENIVYCLISDALIFSYG
jgi:hypothetical protein